MERLRSKPSFDEAGSETFDLLRSRLENDVSRPAVLALTSSTPEDGKEIAARGLARSLATTGYSTLFIDTCLGSASLSKTTQRQSLEEIVLRQPIPDPGSRNLVLLTLSDSLLQRMTNQREMQSALEILRSKFDYVVVSTECGAATSFATSILDSADAVLVTVKKTRREKGADARLRAILDRIGSRFLGVIALDPSAFRNQSLTIKPDVVSDARMSQQARPEKERVVRDIAESPT